MNCQVTWHLRVANGCKWLVLHCGSFKTCPIKRTRSLGISDLEEIQITVGFALEDAGSVPTLVFTVVVLFFSVSGLVP